MRGPKPIDLIGRTFGRLTVRELAGRGPARWRCQCVCGREIIALAGNLRRGNTTSCGCFHREQTGKITRSHGRSKTPTYRSWSIAKRRCTNPRDITYPLYGGRGIRMCERWANSFAAFLTDMGARPPGHTLDRIDNDRGYEPANCRWATPRQQALNRRNLRLYTHDGFTGSIKDLAIRAGLSPSCVYQRLKAGQTISHALSH